MRASRLGITLVRSRIAYPLCNTKRSVFAARPKAGGTVVRRYCLLILAMSIQPSALFAQGITVVDSDSTISFVAPDGWSHAQLGNPDASIQMASPDQDAFLLLIVEPKDDFFGWNMTRFLYVTLGQAVAALDFPEVSDIEHTQVDGATAAVVRASGAASGQQYRFLRIAIDAPAHWVQLIFASLRSGWEANEAIFGRAVESVEVLPR